MRFTVLNSDLNSIERIPIIDIPNYSVFGLQDTISRIWLKLQKQS